MASLKAMLRVLLRPTQSVPPAKRDLAAKRDLDVDRLVAGASRGNVNLMRGRFITEAEVTARRARVARDDSDLSEG